MTTELTLSLPLMSGARCKGEDPAMWDLDRGTPRQLRQGSDICRYECPIRELCAALGDRKGEWGMVWGGIRRKDSPRAQNAKRAANPRQVAA